MEFYFLSFGQPDWVQTACQRGQNPIQHTMMKRYFASFLMLLIAVGLWGTPRTREQALDVARSMSLRRAPSHQVLTTQPVRIAEEGHAYYAVNTGTGFVLVSTDTSMPDILGYSDGSDFCADSLPPAFRFWLQSYDDEMAALDTASNRSVPALSFSDEQKPLLSCTWNQSSPFNDLAPMYDATHHAAAGCVATAMAQVMYAYKFPAQGTGSHSYLWTSKRDASLSATLTADFGNTTYDWNSMLDSYSGSASEQQRAAVATLLYHCGVAVDMGYDCNSTHESGAVTSKVPRALASYFGYDPHYQFIRKDIYTADSLSMLIRAELQQQRPVLVSGSNDQGGHAFVCDGYNRNGYFHINWGWGGKSDGYFLLSALNPGQQGIGGTTKGYNKGTTFYVGLRPAEEASVRYPTQLAADSFTVNVAQLSRQESFAVSAFRIQNYGMDDYSGSCGIALYNEDETEMIAQLKTASFSLKSGYYRTSAVTTSNIKIPTSVAEGTYHLCAVYKDENYGWLRMLSCCDDYYKTIYISSDDITFFDNHAPAELSLTAPICFEEDAHTILRSGAPLSFSIRNTGGTFRGDISARIYQGNFAKGQYEVMDSVSIRRNQTFSSALQQAFNSQLVAGKNYKMKLCWRANASDSWHEFTPTEYGIVSFTIQDEQPDTPTAIDNTESADTSVISRQWLMHLPIGDLYIVTTKENNTIQRKKIILHQ